MPSLPKPTPLQRERLLLLLLGASAAAVLPAIWRRLRSLRRKRGLPPVPTPAAAARSTTSSAGGGADAYETRKAVDEYLQFHFGRPEDIIPYDIGPKEALRFTEQLAALCERHCSALRDFTGEGGEATAVDIGCAVGGASFHLARAFPHVLGIDFSQHFVNAANTMRERGWMRYTAAEEGELSKENTAVVPEDIDRSRVRFQQADACNLPGNLGPVDAVLAANLLCRLPDPTLFLGRMHSFIKRDGVLVLVSPYSWLPGWTPRDKWLGGFLDQEGKPVWTADVLKKLLGEHFTLVEEAELPFVIREHRRKFQWGVSHAMAPVVSRRADATRAPRHQRLRVQVQASLSAEQQAFLERRRSESRSPAAAPTRGRSTVLRSPVRPASSTPARGRSSAPAPAQSNGLTAEQQAFLERRRSESRSPAPAPTRGRSTVPRSPVRPSSRAPSARPAASSPASYSPPSSAPAGGLSAEQKAFMDRRRSESRPAASAPTRGRSTVPRRPITSSSAPRRASSSAPSASYSAPSSAPAGGLSAEQQAFLERHRSESRSAAPAPTRGRSTVPRSPVRPTSRAPSARPAASSPTSYSPPSSAPAGGLSAEQQAFMDRRRSESRSPAPAPTRGRSAVTRSPVRPTSRAPAAPAARTPSVRPSARPTSRPASGRPSSRPAAHRSGASSSPASSSGLSAEQQAFLDRKRSGGR
ncbi:hypothetical protein D9Q98_005324 [Chlorella vulgaris]|uniref:Methyltransferase type 12 domain-containing protein n=1 Tax=Chlorella vulgaris TaxID=3077 RepID=A0A9D4TMI0_CHLVU|nr:hypothetical protein D9Q98_005324 [Chlorella vulgaris]